VGSAIRPHPKHLATQSILLPASRAKTPAGNVRQTEAHTDTAVLAARLIHKLMHRIGIQALSTLIAHPLRKARATPCSHPKITAIVD
jgi:hypothetical protein